MQYTNSNSLAISRINKTPITNVLRALGVDLTMSMSVSCFLLGHESDSTPSLKVYIGTNSFYCYGCKRGGKPCDLWAYAKGVPRTVACHQLEQLLGVPPLETITSDLERSFKSAFDTFSELEKSEDSEEIIKLSFGQLDASVADILREQEHLSQQVIEFRNQFYWELDMAYRQKNFNNTTLSNLKSLEKLLLSSVSK